MPTGVGRVGVCPLWEADMTWKDTERAIAKRLGGQRVGNTGSATPDVVSDRLAVECKSRETLPLSLKDAVVQAVRGADGGRVPVMALLEKHKRHGGDLVVMRLREFERRAGTVS